MNFKKLDFLIFSSHKTSTQTILNTLLKNGYKSIHCHSITNFFNNYGNNVRNNSDLSNKAFIEGLNNYKKYNNKKLRIISVIRNPNDRLISSFFQSHYDDEIMFLNKTHNETTVFTKTEEELFNLYNLHIKNNSLHGKIESIDELSNLTSINIISRLKKLDGYYYLDDDLFELFVLDFKQVISNSSIDYLNNILNINITTMHPCNNSKQKCYYIKYQNVKAMINDELSTIIESTYDPFYFNAFV